MVFKNNKWEIEQSFSNQNFGWIITLALIFFSFHFYSEIQINTSENCVPQFLSCNQLFRNIFRVLYNLRWLFQFFLIAAFFLFLTRKLYTLALSFLSLSYLALYFSYLASPHFYHNIYNFLFILTFMFLFIPLKKNTVPSAILLFFTIHCFSHIQTNWLSGWNIIHMLPDGTPLKVAEVLSFFYIVIQFVFISLLLFSKMKFNIIGLIGLTLSELLVTYSSESFMPFLFYFLFSLSIIFFNHEKRLTKLGLVFVSFLHPEANKAWSYFVFVLLIALQSPFILPHISPAFNKHAVAFSFLKKNSYPFQCQYTLVSKSKITNEDSSSPFYKFEKQILKPIECQPLRTVLEFKSLCKKVNHIELFFQFKEMSPDGQLKKRHYKNICDIAEFSEKDVL